MKRWLWLILAITLLLPGPAFSADLDSYLNQASKMHKDNKPLEAVTSLRQAITYVWERMPLTVKKTALVSVPAPSYGLFDHRPDNVFKTGDKVLIYAEPVGYRFARAEKGLQFGIACDLAVISKQGKVLGGQNNFGKWVMNCGEPMFEFFMNLTITLTEFPPGEYNLVLTFRDLVGKGQTSIKQPIVVK